MANNFSQRRAQITAPFFVCFIYLSCSLFLTSCAAHKTKKYYSAYIQGNGMLYHANTPYSFHDNSGNHFVYDITYLPDKDSAILNFSFYDKAAITIDSISLARSGSTALSAPAKRIFIEQRKNKWHYRYTAAFGAAVLNKLLLQNSSAPLVAIHTDKGGLSLSISNKHWKWQYAVLSKVITLKTLNTGK